MLHVPAEGPFDIFAYPTIFGDRACWSSFGIVIPVRFFNAFDIDRAEYLPMDGFLELFNKLQLPTVPVLSTDYTLGNDIAAIVKMATIKSSLHADAWAEGIVIRPLVEKRNVLLSNEHFNSNRVTFKAINPEFLLKYGE